MGGATRAIHSDRNPAELRLSKIKKKGVCDIFGEMEIYRMYISNESS